MANNKHVTMRRGMSRSSAHTEEHAYMLYMTSNVTTCISASALVSTCSCTPWSRATCSARLALLYPSTIRLVGRTTRTVFIN